MKRKLFLTAAFLSLLVCAGSIWWWIGSSGRMDQLSWQARNGPTVRLYGADGKVAFIRSDAAPAEAATGRISWGSVPYVSGRSDAEPQLQWTSFTYSTHPADRSGAMQSTLILPVWAIAGVTALLPMLWTMGKMKPKKKPH
jgi:hypothetical protein